MRLKKCWKCKELKTLDQFYKSRNSYDGYCSACKICGNLLKTAWQKSVGKLKHSIIVAKYKKSKKGKFKDHLRRMKPDVKSKLLNYQRHYRTANKEKYIAHWKVSKAIKTGKLLKRPCQCCQSEENLHAHHTDYSSPLDVTWLCAKCHKLEHIKIQGTA